MRLLFLLMLLPWCTYAQHDSLPGVTVRGQVLPEEQSFPSQHLNKEKLNAMNANSVADAGRFFPGVLIKDYGGLGGLKTISVRSLGANHTAVMYDGMVWNDAQNGQIDLGKISLNNIEKISLYYAQPDVLLIPARALAASSVLSLQSSSFTKPAPQINLSASFKTGSFGLINPSLYLKRVFNKTSHAFSGEWLSSDGAYKFPSINNDGKHTRKNTEVSNVRAEYDFTYQATDSSKLHLKLYYYASDRELPGAVILNNTDADDYLKDKSALAQIFWRKPVNARSSFLLNAKYHYLQSHYVDPTYNNQAGRINNNFHQHETYISGVYAYNFTKEFSLAVSTDLFRNDLKRTDTFAINFKPVQRYSMLNALNAQWKNEQWLLNGGVVYTFMNDKVKGVSGNKSDDDLSYFAGINFKPFRKESFNVRLSYKETFRAPTFNDLYYTLVGNTALKPEDTKMINAGLSYHFKTNNDVQLVSISVDAYLNKIKNKIQAMPRENLFHWSMLNIGKVQVFGVDVQTGAKWMPAQNLQFDLMVSYTYQQAKDVTNPAAPNYKQPLAYTPEHSGSALLQTQYRKFVFNYSLLFSGYRYKQGDRIPDNYLEGFLIQDVKLIYNFKIKKLQTSVFAEINNIGDHHYEIIRFYPMPGTHYRVGITLNQSILK